MNRPVPRPLLSSLALSAGLCVAAAGCAGYSITCQGTGEGYDVYRPEPYILAVRGADRSGRSTVTASVVWLPDYGARYRLDTWSVLASADVTFKIADGWRLTEVGGGGDSEEAVKGLAELAQHLLAAGTIALSDTEPLLLFKVLYDADGRVTGLARLPAGSIDDHHPPPPPTGV